MSENVKSIDRAKEAAGESVDKARTAVKETVGVARTKAQDVKEEVGKKLKDVSKDVRKEAEKAGEYAKERYDEAVHNLRGGYTRARKDLDQLSQDVNAYVRDNPGRSILIAAGVGFLVGLLLRPDRRR